MSPALPLWITALPEEKRSGHQLTFLLRLAALHATPSGQLPELSLRIGRNDAYLTHLCHPKRPNRGEVSAEDAIAIEQIVGRDVMPREWLRPDLFLVTR